MRRWNPMSCRDFDARIRMAVGYHLMFVVSTGLFVAGCLGDKAAAPSVRPAATTIGTISASPTNAVMAIGDTLSIHVVGQTLGGTPMTSFDSVLYLLQQPNDSLRVRVSLTGVVTALTQTNPWSPVRLQVVAFKDGLARADVAYLTIVPTAFSGATLSIQPSPGSSADVSSGSYLSIQPVIENPTTGASAENTAIRLEFDSRDSATVACYLPTLTAIPNFTAAQLALNRCTDTGIGSPNLNELFALAKGTVWVHANVTVFGAALRDSVQYQIINTQNGVVYLFPGILGLYNGYGAHVYIAPGGVVSFNNGFDPGFAVLISFTFDHPEAATATTPPSTDGDSTGNITPLASNASSTRRFLTPGTYTWTATVTSGAAPFPGQATTGTITVR